MFEAQRQYSSQLATPTLRNAKSTKGLGTTDMNRKDSGDPFGHLLDFMPNTTESPEPFSQTKQPYHKKITFQQPENEETEFQRGDTFNDSAFI
jgi:hypothetical protein